MAPPTIFTRPRRQIQGATSTNAAEQPARTLDELLAAITRISSIATDTTNILAAPSIALVGTFSITSPIIIPPECIGMTIVQRGGVLIAGAAAITACFDIRARYVVLDRIIATRIDTAHYFTSFVILTDDAGADGPAFNVLDKCVVVADRLFVDSAAGSGNNHIIHCRQAKVSGSTSAAVELSTNRNRVMGNHLSDGGGDSVVISSGSRNAVVGNDLGGGDYTSTASGGLNTFSANTAVGTVTAHATDDTLGGNTA